MSQPSKSLDNVYSLSKLFTCQEIKLSAWNKSSNHELLILFVNGESFIYYYFTPENPIIKQIPWFNDPHQAPVSIDLSPSGTFLLVLSKSCHLYILPVLSLLDGTFRNDLLLDTNDLTMHTYPFSPKVTKVKSKPKSSNSSLSIITSLSIQSSSSNNEKQRSSSTSSSDSLGSENIMKLKEISGSKCEAHPVVVCWWQTLESSQDVAIIGMKSGEILFVDLITGIKIGETKVKGEIKNLSVCQDNDGNFVFLLITAQNNIQYRLMLEQQSLNYVWSAKQNSNGNGDDCVDANIGNGSGNALPLARARLHGLKQMSAEKLASLKHKIAETRSKMGAKQGTTDENGPGLKSNGPPPENLGFVIGDTLISPQSSLKGKFLAGYYAQTQLLTVHSMNLDIEPLVIHKMPADVEEVLICDRVIFLISNARTNLQVISSILTQTLFDQSDDFNPESVLGSWNFNEHNEKTETKPTAKEESPLPKPDLIPDDFSSKSAEKIMNVYGSVGKIDEYNIAKIYNLEKTKEELPEEPKIENCVVVTNKSVYVVELQRNMVKMALDLILDTHELEKAEKICTVFGINLQKLLELAGDIKLASLKFSTAIALYKLSKCGLLKSIVKLACGNHCSQVLNYSTMLMANSLSDMSLTERIHLSNLILMAYTQQILKNESNRHLMEKFLDFLQKNSYFDEVLAVSVTGQSLLFHCLHKLITHKGLILDGYNVLIKLMERFINSKVLEWSLNKNEFWKCATEVDLIEAMVVSSLSFPTYTEYVTKNLNDLDEEYINRLLKLLDPTAPTIRPIARIFKKDDSFDNDVLIFQTVFPFDKLIELFTLALLVKLYKERENGEYKREFILPSPDVSDVEGSEFSFQDSENFGSRENLGEEIWPIRKEIQADNEKFRKRVDGILNCGYGHTALIRNGCVYTWGQTAKGCLGHGPTMSRYATPSPISWFGFFKLEVSVVSCGKFHTAALTNNGVYTWGCSRFGQLGLGDIHESPHPRLVSSLANENVIFIACGQYHTLALTNQGSVFAWGWGVHGQLGLGTTDNQRHPKYINTLKEHFIVDIAAGHGHSVVLSDKGHVYTFGSSVFGQLGTGLNVKSSIPVFVKGITGRVISISTGYFHSLALTDANTLYSWGSSPQCLRFQAQARKKSRLLQNQNSSNSVDSEVTKSNEEGQEQTPTTNGHLDKAESEMHFSPSLVDTSNVTGNIIQISCGCHHSALVTSCGGLYTWGISIDGQLGNGSHKEVSIPTQINSENFKVDVVSCGCEFTTAEEKHTGQIYCWGNNAVGQLAIPIKESATKSLEGKLIVLKSFKRIARFLDRGAGSVAVDKPRKIPEIPSPTFTYHTLSQHISSSLGSLSDIDPEYSHRSLHFVIEKFTNYMNLPLVFKKCLEYRNFQAASKILLLQNKCKQSTVYQLKALQDIPKYRFKSGSYLEKSKEEKASQETQEIHLFTVEGGHEDMCDESGTGNEEKLDDFGDQNGKGNEEKMKNLKSEYMDHAKYIVETYLNLNSSQVYEDFDNCSILETAVQFWTAEKLPMNSLEDFLCEKLDEIFYDLGYFLFCTQQKDSQGSVLEQFSTGFLLSVTSKILSRVEKNESCVEYLETMTKILTNDDNLRKAALTKKKRPAKRKKPKSEMYLEEIRDNLQHQGANENFIKISYGDMVGDNVYFFSCGHHHSSKSLEEDCKVFHELTDETVASKLINFYSLLDEEHKGDFACPSCVRNYLRQ